MVLSSLTSGFRCMRYAIQKGTVLLGDISGVFPTAEVRRKSPMRDPANTAAFAACHQHQLFLLFLILPYPLCIILQVHNGFLFDPS